MKGVAAATIIDNELFVWLVDGDDCYDFRFPEADELHPALVRAALRSFLADRKHDLEALEARGAEPAHESVAAFMTVSLLGAEPAQVLLGDLREKFSIVSGELGVSAANGWYWAEIARSTLPLVWSRMCRSRWLAAMLGWIFGRAA